MYLYTLAADVIEQNSKKIYAMIIDSLINKNSITFKLKNLMNNGRISTAGRPLVHIKSKTLHTSCI
jgi:hypothetical protein